MSKVTTEQELELSFDGKISDYRKPKKNQYPDQYAVEYGDGLIEHFTSWYSCCQWLQNQMYLNGGMVKVSLIRLIR